MAKFRLREKRFVFFFTYLKKEQTTRKLRKVDRNFTINFGFEIGKNASWYRFLIQKKQQQ